jgi:TP901 family phage tail tape measure protein
MQNVNIVFNANANFGDLVAEVRRVNAELAGLNTQMMGLDAKGRSSVLRFNRDFAETLKLSGQFDTSIVTASDNISNFGKNLDAGRLRLKDYYRAWKTSASSAQSEVRKLAEQQVRLERSIVKQTGTDARGRAVMSVFTPRGLDLNKTDVVSAVNQKRVQIFNEMIKKGSTELINWGKNTQWAGRQLTVGLTVPMTIFAGTAATAFKKADEQLTRLAKVYGDVGGATQEQITRIKSQSMDLARTLAADLGAPLEQTLGLTADIAATGRMGDDLIKATAETTRLAVLGEVDRQQALETTLSLQNAFNLSTEQLTESINFLNAVENQTSTTLQDLTVAIPKAGPVINALGGDVKDLALFLSAMVEGGVNAGEAANAIKSGFASLINPTKQTVEVMDRFGISINSIIEGNAGDLVGTIMELKTALDGLDPLSKTRALEQLFGKYQVSRITALFDNIGAAGSQTVEVMKLMEASTTDLAATADRELQILTESASGKFNRQIQRLKANLADIGEGFIPAFTMALDLINKLIEGFNNLPGPVKNILNILGGLVALAGPVIMLAGVFGNFFGYLIKGLGVVRRFITGTKGFQLVTADTIAMRAAAEGATNAIYDEAVAMGVLRSAANSLTRELSTLIARQNTLASGAVRGPIVPRRRYNNGVFRVPGTGSGDTVPAMLTPGESVIPKDMTQRYGPLIDAMIKGEIPGYQRGRRPTYWDANKRNELLDALGLGPSERLRMPLAEQSRQYSLSGILAPKSVNTSSIGMTREYLQSGMGRAALSANIQVGLEDLGLSAERTAKVLDIISPKIKTAIDNFDGSIDSWKTGTQIAMQELKQSADISPSELAAIQSRFAPVNSLSDYPVSSTPIQEIGRRRARYRDEGRTSSPLYQKERAAAILREQGYDPTGMVFSHMPGYEKITGEMITDPSLPTVSGRQLTQSQLDVAIPARNEYQLFREANANAVVQGNKIAQATVTGIEQGTEQGIQSASPSKRFMKIGNDAANGAAIGFSQGLDDLTPRAAAAGRNMSQMFTMNPQGSYGLPIVPRGESSDIRTRKIIPGEPTGIGRMGRGRSGLMGLGMLAGVGSMGAFAAGQTGLGSALGLVGMIDMLTILPKVSMLAAAKIGVLSAGVGLLAGVTMQAYRNNQSLNASFINSKAAAEEFGISIDNAGDSIKSIGENTKEAKDEIEALRESLMQDDEFKKLVDRLSRPTGMQRLFLKTDLTNAEALQEAQIQVQTLVTAGYETEDAKKIMQILLQESGRAGLFIGLDFDMTRAEALSRLIQNFENGEESIKNVAKSANDFLADMISSATNAEKLTEALLQIRRVAGITGAVFNSLKSNILSANEGLQETDPTMYTLIQNAKNASELFLTIKASSLGIASNLVSAARNANTLGQLVKSFVDLPETVKDILGPRPSAERSSQKVATNYDNQLKSIDKQIDALKEKERIENNINKLKQLQIEHERSLMDMSVSLSQALAGGDLAEAARIMNNITAEEEGYRREYVKTRREIKREDEIARLERLKASLQEAKEAASQATKSIANKAQEAYDKASSSITKFIQDNNGIMFTSIDQLKKKMGPELLASIEQSGKNVGSVLAKVQQEINKNFGLSSGLTPQEFKRYEALQKAGQVGRLSGGELKEVEALGSKIKSSRSQLAIDTQNMQVQAQSVTILGLSTTGPTGKPLTGTYQLKANGGYISGPGGPKSDIIPAMLSNGEFVINAAAVKKYGLGMMNQINSQSFGMGGLAMPKYGMGGSVAKYGGGGYVAKYAEGGMVTSSNNVTYNVNMSINNPGASAEEIWTLFQSKMEQEKRRMGKNKKVVY